jgi:hypothetical protein
MGCCDKYMQVVGNDFWWFNLYPKIYPTLIRVWRIIDMAKRDRIYLTAEQKTRLEGLTDDINWLQEEIRRAEFVGIEVEELKARFEKMKTIRERMLTEYVKS